MIKRGDCLVVLPTLEADSVDACVTDPPYGLAFMGKEWDDLTRHAYRAQEWHERWAREVYRVLKPGAYLLAFGGTRTFHRLACGIEDAGFEIRDTLSWLFGQGFPKSLSPFRSIMGALCQSHERAQHAVGISPLIPLLLPKARASIALGLALIQPEGEPALRIQIGEAGDSGEVLTVISSSAYQMAATTLNIGSSWLHNWGGSSDETSTFITGMVSRMTTDRRILKFCSSVLTQSITIPAASRPDGCKCDVAAVIECSSDGEPSMTVTPMLIARGAVTAKLNALKPLGTATKPGWEPIVMARKPLRGTVAANVQQFGTGAINVDGCRIAGLKPDVRMVPKATEPQIFKTSSGTHNGELTTEGRWPANVCLDEVAAAMLDDQAGELVSGANPTRRGSDKFRGIYSAFQGQAECDAARGQDTGGASRFFYVAKPSREERDLGCDGLPMHSGGELCDRKDGSAGLNNPRAGAGRSSGGRNTHPTVKPLALMRWLVRLVTPPGGVVLDPFTGSGTTGMACAAENVRFIGIEREAEYIAIAERRIAAIAPLFQETA
jgi:DNA modification methylase